MVADFGRNVTRRMDPSLSAAEREAPAAMNPVAMFAAVLWARLKRLFGMGHN
jgi:carbon-monoxide dehydrogenase small subunit